MSLESPEPVDDFSNAGPIQNLRYWLIKKIAGQCVVILNAKISMVQHSGHAARVTDVNGAFISGSSFPVKHGLMLEISQRGVE